MKDKMMIEEIKIVVGQEYANILYGYQTNFIGDHNVKTIEE